VSLDALDASILGPALGAGLLVLATHVPLGREVLARGIIFIDLAIAQVSGLGAIAASQLHLELGGFGAEVGAGLAALAGALLLTWIERLFPDILEALIGVLFVLAATGGILLLANDPHGGEELKDLLVGQILWVSPRALVPIALLYAGVLALWALGASRLGRGGFYLLFAATVTASVQLVGVYLVFATLIVPSVAARGLPGARGLGLAFAVGLGGYLLGLGLSAVFDLPTGAVIVWTLAALAIVTMTVRRGSRHQAAEPAPPFQGPTISGVTQPP
jgi:zinc/manganese transport system permease protein